MLQFEKALFFLLHISYMFCAPVKKSILPCVPTLLVISRKMELELFGEIVLVVFQRTPVDKRVSSGVGSQGVTTLKSKQSFLLIESAACPPPPLHTDTYYPGLRQTRWPSLREWAAERV